MKFRSTILEPDGRTVQLDLEAADAQALHEDLHRQGRALLRVDGTEVSSARVRSIALSPRRLLMLTQALQEALDAGVPLLTTFSAIAEQEEDERMLDLLEDLGQRIASGQSLAEALRAHPRAFPAVYCALVRAGEQSGSLPRVLHSVVGFLEWRLEITGVVRQALVYPMVVGAAGYAMVLFLLSFVIPRLGGVLAKMGGELPAASRALLATSGFVSQNLWAVIGVSVAALFVLLQLFRSRAAASALALLAGHLPVVGAVLGSLAVAQFCRTFGVLLNAGLAMPQALELTGETIGASRLRQRIADVHERILGGARLSEAVKRYQLLPPVALSMLQVGEEAGRLPVTFERLGRLYDREVREQVKKALGLLEPLVTVLLGLMVGGIAVIVVGTIYSALRGIGK